MTIPAPRPDTPEPPPIDPGHQPEIPQDPGPDRTIPRLPLDDPAPPQRQPAIVLD